MKENSWDREAVNIIVFGVFVNVILTKTSVNYLAVFKLNFFSLSTCLKFSVVERSGYYNGDCSSLNT